MRKRWIHSTTNTTHSMISSRKENSYLQLYTSLVKSGGRGGGRRGGGREEGRKGGREEGRKGGREEGRKGGREEGRKGGRERYLMSKHLRQWNRTFLPLQAINKSMLLGRRDVTSRSFTTSQIVSTCYTKRRKKEKKRINKLYLVELISMLFLFDCFLLLFSDFSLDFFLFLLLLSSTLPHGKCR